MIREEPDTVYFTVDIGMWAIRDILSEFPERAMNVGIYEDAMISIAAGISSRGLVPTIFGIQPYLIERCLEQIKMDLAYQNNGVNIIGTGAAVDYAKYGYSHYCAGDIALIKMYPGVEFVAPGSPGQFDQLFKTCYRNGRPTFFRISDHPNTEYDTDVVFGKAQVIQTGSKATVIAVSVMLDKVMKICAHEDVTVLYYTTLEPFDSETLADNCENGKVLICEPQYSGSLDYDVLESLKGRSVLIEHIGFPREIFRNYGTNDDKTAYYGLTSDNIKYRLKSLIS
jgi:transketolase